MINIILSSVIKLMCAHFCDKFVIIMIKWKLKDYLDTHDITAYKLIRRSGLASNTVYEMARGESESASLKTLETVIKTLSEMTREQVSLTDVVEIVEDEPTSKLEDKPQEEVKGWRSLIGLFDDLDSPGDISANVDKYLGEALEEEYLKNTRVKR